MKTVQGLRHKGNFVVASPHAGFSNVTNNAAQSIFLIIPSPNDSSFNRKVLLRPSRFASVVFASGVWPDPVFPAAGDAGLACVLSLARP